MNDIERRLKNIEQALFGKSDTVWHSQDTLSDGALVAMLGSLTHLVDIKGYPISKGYHTIEVYIPRHSYIGQLGATKEHFDCYMQREMIELIRKKE